jgi:hypothetical protein
MRRCAARPAPKWCPSSSGFRRSSRRWRRQSARR